MLCIVNYHFAAFINSCNTALFGCTLVWSDFSCWLCLVKEASSGGVSTFILLHFGPECELKVACFFKASSILTLAGKADLSTLFLLSSRKRALCNHNGRVLNRHTDSTISNVLEGWSGPQLKSGYLQPMADVDMTLGIKLSTYLKTKGMTPWSAWTSNCLCTGAYVGGRTNHRFNKATVESGW